MYEGKKEESDAQRDEETCLRSHRLLVTKLNKCPQIPC